MWLQAALFALLCAALAYQPLQARDDFWSHAAVGRWILSNNAIPRETLFLATAHQEWIAHSWGTQVGFFALMLYGGESGPLWAQWFTTAVVLGTYFVIWRLWKLRGTLTLLTTFVFFVAACCAVSRYHPRPELWSGLFTACVLTFVVRAVDDAKPLGVWHEVTLAAMFLLWANLHGGVLLGLLFLGLGVLGAVWRELHDKTQPRAKRLALLWVACAVATLGTPYGWRYYQAFNAENRAVLALIREWFPLWRPPFLTLLPVIGYLLLLAGALRSWKATPHRHLVYVLWLLAASVLFFSARRHNWTFCLVCLTVMAAHAPRLEPQTLWRAVFKRDANVAVRRGASLLGSVALAWLFATSNPLRLLWQPPVAPLPDGLVTSLLQVPPNARVFNDYETAGYLEWRLGGNPPLYIDLLNAYPAELINEQMSVLDVTAHGQDVLAARDFNVVVLRAPNTNGESWPTLAYALDRDARWKRIYTGPDGAVWLRR